MAQNLDDLLQRIIRQRKIFKILDHTAFSNKSYKNIRIKQ